MARLHHRNRSRKLRKEARRIPVPGHFDYGDGRDAGKYFRCWNCGWICDVDRDKLGGVDDRPGVSPKAYTMIGQYGTALRGGASDNSGSRDLLAGDEMTGEGYTTTRYVPEVSEGCPLCGTVNWRGDHP
jgi:hypothetical protein